MDLLEVTDITVQYGKLRAVDGVTINVRESEVVAIIGPNGAGKSTLLAAISGLVAPSSGDVRFSGERITGETPDRIARRGVILVPEGRHIFGTLTVAENLRLGMTSRPDRDAAAGELGPLLDRFPALRTYYDSSSAKLSGGEQQQLAIARALLAKPRLLMLDEPSLGLAPLTVDLVFNALKELGDRGMTILLIEQNAMRAIELADRTYVLRAGRVIRMAERAQMMAAEEEVAEAYLGFGDA
jgi:branched-chain amino acid transport system ATP-binding protein